jgi:hypothetical protein
LKILVLLLSVYFAGILSLPCQDNLKEVNSCQTNDCCDGETNEHDACQPFCNCACCSAAIIFHKVILNIQSPLRFETTQFSEMTISSSKFVTAIWQPPKTN